MMRGTLLIFRPGKMAPDVKEIDFAPLSELDRLQVLKDGIGGGYIEAVPYFLTIEHAGELHRCIAFCDEDGKRKQLDHNIAANEHWRRAMRRAAGCSPDPDYLVGDVAVVFGDAEFMEVV